MHHMHHMHHDHFMPATSLSMIFRTPPLKGSFFVTGCGSPPAMDTLCVSKSPRAPVAKPGDAVTRGDRKVTPMWSRGAVEPMLRSGQ